MAKNTLGISSVIIGMAMVFRHTQMAASTRAVDRKTNTMDMVSLNARMEGAM